MLEQHMGLLMGSTWLGTQVSEVKTIHSILDVCKRGDDRGLRGDSGILNSHLSSVTLEKCHSQFSLRTISYKMKRLHYINDFFLSCSLDDKGVPCLWWYIYTLSGAWHGQWLKTWLWTPVLPFPCSVILDKLSSSLMIDFLNWKKWITIFTSLSL